jgi:hypothetical protein
VVLIQRAFEDQVLGVCFFVVLFIGQEKSSKFMGVDQVKLYREMTENEVFLCFPEVLQLLSMAIV